MTANTIADFFAANGKLAQAITSYTPRQQQIEMAVCIAEAINSETIFIAEAGTGTGKTFAYLVPAMLKGGKVIVSTGTKTLQDQLFNNDIPLVRDALKAPIRVALLKGRANYVCHYYLERAQSEGRFSSIEETQHLRSISKFAETSKSGDRAECFAVPEGAAIWSQVVSSRENCLGQECPNYSECFVLKARREALQADLVVVNHHLFFADIALREEGIAELLPTCQTVIFDEAHQLPDVASDFFAESISTTQLIELARDIRQAGLMEARDCLELQQLSLNIDKAARDLRLTVGLGQNSRFNLQQVQAMTEFIPTLEKLQEFIQLGNELLATQEQRSEGLANCYERILIYQEKINNWLTSGLSDYVRWVEVFSSSLQLHATPLDIAPLFLKIINEHQRAWIFTSATLTVRNDFQHYCQQLGLQEAKSSCWDSPFDYPQQSLLFAPQAMPDPNSDNFSDVLVDRTLPILRAMATGGAFFLCTSIRAMRKIHQLLSEQLTAADGYSLLLQGEAGKHDLLRVFRENKRSILVGSQSFWEGVDVRGEALSLVVIDKIPFAPPDDPVLSVRLKRIADAGGNGFMQYQLPQAVINIKQGAGRLIRDHHDRGVLVIADPRLLTKQYGKQIWRSLPPMRRTKDLQDVLDFFHKN